MPHGRIRTEWASVLMAPAGEVIVCVRQNGTSQCIGFSIAEQLRQAIATRQLVARRWVTVMPRSAYIAKSLTLPTSDLAEAMKMIEFELPSLVPLPPEEIAYGCHLSRADAALMTLSVYVLRTKALEQGLAPYHEMGIEPDIILVDLLALQSWFEAACPDAGGVSVSALIDQDRCVILCSEGDRLLATSDAVWSQQGAAEVARQMWCYSQMEVSAPGDPCCAFRLAGPEESSSRLEDQLRSLAGAYSGRAPTVRRVPSTTESCHPWNGQSVSSGVPLYECALAAGALEAAAREAYPHANLVPARTFAARNKRAQWRNYGVAAGLVLLSVLLAWTLAEAANWRVRQEVHALESQIAALEKVAGDVEGKRVLIRAVERQFSNRSRILAVIEELYRYVPDSISVHQLVFESRHGEPSVEIRGQARTAAAAWDLPQAFQKARLLKNVAIDDIGEETSQSDGTSRATFRIHCALPDK